MGLLARLRSAIWQEPQVIERAGRIHGPESVVGQLPLSQQLQRIGGNLTPNKVSEIIRLADAGYVDQLVDLGNEARQKDCHLQSTLFTRESAVAGLDWTVRAPKRARRKDRKAAEFVDEVIRECVSSVDGRCDDASTFPELLGHLGGGVFWGYAVSETVFAKDAGYIVPRGFVRIAPRRFVFDEQFGHLRWFDAYGGKHPGVDLRATYPGKFLQFQPRITGDVPCREGLVRVLMWAALFRNWDMRDWLALAELAWKPWRVGQYAKGASKEDIANLYAILNGLTASGVAAHPDTTKLEIGWKGGTGSSGSGMHAELAQFLAAEMSKAVLGQTLTTEQGRVGSNALGQVHDQVRRDIRESDARAIAACIRRDLVAPLVRLNFGRDVAIPEFVFLTDDAVDMGAFAKAVSTLVKAGLRVPASFVRDRVGLPEPLPDDEVLEAPTAKPGVPPVPPQAPPPSDGDDEDEDEPPKAASTDRVAA